MTSRFAFPRAVLSTACLLVSAPLLQASLDLPASYDAAAADPDPTSQGWSATEVLVGVDNSPADGLIDSGANVGPVNAGAAWQINDQLPGEAANLPTYSVTLSADDQDELIANGWTFSARVRAVAPDDDYCGFIGWGIGAQDDGQNRRVAFLINQDNGAFEIQVQSASPTTITLDPESAADFHTITAVGVPDTEDFEWFVDGVSYGTVSMLPLPTALDLTGGKVTFSAGTSAGAGNVFDTESISLRRHSLVTNNLDSGPGSLRQMVADADPNEKITFAPGLGTISLASEISITKALTIDASALPDGITVDGNDTVRVFSIDAPSGAKHDITPATGATAFQTSEWFSPRPASNAIDGNADTFSHTDVTGADTEPFWEVDFGRDLPVGKVVLNNEVFEGTEFLSDLTITLYDAAGTAIYESSTLNAQNGLNGPASLTDHMPSTLMARKIRVSKDGGGLTLGEVEVFERSVVNLKNLTITRGYTPPTDTPPTSLDYGGGIRCLHPGEVNLTDCTISHCYAPYGGGIGLSTARSSFTVTRCEIVNNSSAQGGGALMFGGGDDNVSVVDTTVRGNEAPYAGGIFITNGSFDRCTFSDNHALTGEAGGVLTLGGVSFNQSTFTGNSATRGGAIFRRGSRIQIRQCTITKNVATEQAGGVYFDSNMNTLENTILADNSAPLHPNFDDDENYEAGFETLRNNLLSGSSELAPLGDYGGYTQTMPPLRGSRALDRILSSTESTDQRGQPRSQGTAVDIGAVESEPFPAAHIVVNNNDAGPGSLRESVRIASPGDIITFDPSLSGETILLASTLLVDRTLDIDASALENKIILDGGNAVRVMDLDRLVTSDNPISVNLVNLIITRGFADGVGTLESSGGGIRSLGEFGALGGVELNITDCTISDCQALGGGGGIALVWNTSFTATRCEIVNNRASNFRGGGVSFFSNNDNENLVFVETTVRGNESADEGGGIYMLSGGSFDQCTFTDNHALGGSGGGALAGSTVSFNQSTFTRNSATIGGGGVYLSSDGSIDQCTFSDNHALGGSGGGARARGRVPINQSTFTRNSATISGGGVFLLNGSIDQCTFSDNQTDGEGGGVFGFTFPINQSTFTRNSAATAGGGVYLSSGGSIDQCTITENEATTSGGGLHGTDLQLLENTILTGNTAHLSPNLNADATTMSNNLLSGSPELAPLGDYGGPTETMPPLPGSPAIDPIGGDTSSLLTTDQRGESRIANNIVDIGSVEYQGATDLAIFWNLDWDGDGNAYGIEHALGTDPNVADPEHANNLSGPTYNSGDPVTRFGLNPAAASHIIWILQHSADLSPGSWSEIYRYNGTADTAQVDIGFDRTSNTVEVTDRRDSGPMAFYRFGAELLIPCQDDPDLPGSP